MKVLIEKFHENVFLSSIKNKMISLEELFSLLSLLQIVLCNTEIGTNIQMNCSYGTKTIFVQKVFAYKYFYH